MSVSKRVDFLIVGQGLAGTILAHELLRHSCTVCIYDRGHRGSASLAASGIINPITGRSFVKSWMFDLLYNEAKRVYQELSEWLGRQLWYEIAMYRTLHQAVDHNKILSRMGDQNYAHHVRGIKQLQGTILAPYVYGPLDLVEIAAARVDIHALIRLARSCWVREGVLREEEFEIDSLASTNGHFKYHDMAARYVVLCQGYQGNQNRFFSDIPISGYLGQSLILERNGWPDAILKRREFILPIDAEHIWFGTANSHTVGEPSSTPEARKLLENRRDKILKNSHVLIEQRVGVRPTLPDRRPTLGESRHLPGLYIFNGLGTKGVSLAPYFSGVLLRHILDKQPVLQEVRADRFF